MGALYKVKSPRIVHGGGDGVRCFLVFFLGILLGIGGLQLLGYGLDWSGLFDGDGDHADGPTQEFVAVLAEERDQLRQELTALERSSQIDREATRLAQQELKNLQEQRQELEKDLEFLRNLAQDAGAGALRIKEFKLTAAEQERTYGYRFTVRQQKEDFGWAKGYVDVSIEGTQGGQAKTLELSELSDIEEEKHFFRFRHFQNIEGEVLLPEGFAPDSLVIDVLPETEKLQSIRETFDWVVGE